MINSILFVAQVQLFECPIHIQWETPIGRCEPSVQLNICQEIQNTRNIHKSFKQGVINLLFLTKTYYLKTDNIHQQCKQEIDNFEVMLLNQKRALNANQILLISV